MNLFLIGDIMLGRNYNKKLNVSKIWGDSLDLIKKNDLVVGNLEMTITDSENKFPDKVFNYKLNTQYLHYFSPLKGKTIFNTANNHILDFRKEGMLDTFTHIREIDCNYIGSGVNMDDCRLPIIKNINGLIVMVFGASDHYDYWQVGKKIGVKGKEGLWYLNLKKYDSSVIECLNYIKKKIEEIQPDLTIFSCHWGHNKVDKIDKNIKKFGKTLIDIGVDIVHGHSAHHIIPYEDYNGGTIFYSLGDFCDDYDHSGPYNKQLSYGVEIKVIGNKKFSYKIHLFNHSNMTIKKQPFKKINLQIT